MKPYDKQLVLENGKQFFGYGFGADKSAINEIVFNTSMVGYQEIVSDPSYTDQMVVMTYPLIGNYGMTDEDYETKIPTMGGLIVREYNDQPSNFRYTKTCLRCWRNMEFPVSVGLTPACSPASFETKAAKKWASSRRICPMTVPCGR